MPAPNRIYFAQIAHGTWQDWVEVINLGNRQADVTAIARDQVGQAIWVGKSTLSPYQCWTIPVEGVADKEGDVSLKVISDQPILGERHCHLGTQVLDFPGAAFELSSIGTRLFFAEIASYIGDWIRFLNVGDSEALISVIAHDRETGRTVNQFQGTATPLGWWTITDAQIGKITGTLEVISTQPIVGERHSHYSGGESAVGQLGQVADGVYPPPKRIYFAQIAPGEWGDWITTTNFSRQQAKLTAILRDQSGNVAWSDEKTLGPYQCWMPAVDKATTKDVSLQIESDQFVLGERHCHLGSQVLSFPGAAHELGTVGTRLFFPEIHSGAYDWFRFLNLGEAEALINIMVRDRNGKILNQFQGRASPLGFWTVGDSAIESATGTLEVMSTQPIVGERHMHYQGWKTAISQLGQVID